MTSTASFVRNAETQLESFRQKNLRHLSTEYGHGFQALLVQLMKQVGMFISPSEVSNLVNAAKNSDGSIRSVFSDATARRVEQALDLPSHCLDVPDWHFRNNLDYFWEYAARAANDRQWFDGLLRRLLVVSAHDAGSHDRPAMPADTVSKIDWAAIRARLQKKQNTEVSK